MSNVNLKSWKIKRNEKKVINARHLLNCRCLFIMFERRTIGMQEAQEKLSDLGVSIFNNQGELRSMRDILQDVGSAYKDLENAIHKVKGTKPAAPLLRIELQDETSVPKVFYEGKEITGGKARVLFNWDTEEAVPNSGGTKFNVEYADVVDGKLIKKGVGFAKGKYIQEDKVAISFNDLTETERKHLSEKLRAWFD